MPLVVKTPLVPSVVRDLGPYRGALNLLDSEETAVQRQVRRAGLGGYEPSTQATLLTLIELSQRPAEFFDIGAHIGLYSALAAAIFPPDVVHVTAFEPTPRTADICVEIAEANHLQIQLERIALSDTVGEAGLFISDKAETSNSLVAGFRPSSATVVVPTSTLDQYCHRSGRLPTVVKIDVETYEEPVVRGGLKTLADCRPAVVCELIPSAADLVDRTVGHFVTLGYTVHRWDPADCRWQPTEPAEVTGLLNSEERDWLFTPRPLEPRFHHHLRQWTDALAPLTKAANQRSAPDAPLPAGWDRPRLANQESP